jgi:disulfide bond formation protein DsbB
VPVAVAPVSTGEAISRGKRAFISCMACHGIDARGVKNMGKDLVASPFVSNLSDDALVAFIMKGRGPTDPGNTTRIAMPPKGGNPALKDEQIRDIVAYLRSLREQSARTE